MRTVIWKAYMNYEKEEVWLNLMASKGFVLIDYAWCRYVFEDSLPGEYTFRIELMEHHPNRPEGREYIKFMEENGVECVATFLRWVYFRKKASDGAFDIYSDIDSRLRHYQRVFRFQLILACLNIMLGLFNLILSLPFVHNEIFPVNLMVSILNLCVGTTLSGVCLRNWKKIKKLKNAKYIQE